MIEIDRLIKLYQDHLSHNLLVTGKNWTEVMTSTITYLVAFKQVHQMLKNLADAIHGVAPGEE